MAKANKKSSTTTPAIDPVVDLSKKLLALWDADDGSQREYSEADSVVEDIKDETLEQFGEWRAAVEKIISYTQAQSIEGALVQLAIALDTLDDISTQGQNSEKMQINRLILSAMRGAHTALRHGIDPDLFSILKIYGAERGNNPIWIDHVNDWAAKGRVQRQSEGG
jgi:hypothetical protein